MVSAMNLLPAQTLSGDNRIHVSDLFALCDTLPSASVDMILCDLPYGTTACKWDQVIPFAPMWARFKRIIKPRGAIVLTASQPFTSALVMSNPQMFRYEWIWEKDRGSGFLDANRKPIKTHESVLVFGAQLPNYSPQKTTGHPPINRPGNNRKQRADVYEGKFISGDGGATDRFPRSVQKFNTHNSSWGIVHPTQKPVALFEYLIKTYTQAGELVFDPCVGSGTTAVACVNTGRRYICGDQSAEYVAIARERVRKAQTEARQLELIA